MTHEACRALLIDLAYGELDRRAALRVEDHLAGCPECRTEWELLGATRRTMQALKPVEPDAGGERILLAAARQAAEARAATRQARLFPGWVWKLSATAAAVLVVGGVSYRILWPQQALQVPDRGSAVYDRAEANSPTVAHALPSAAPAPKPAPSAVHGHAAADSPIVANASPPAAAPPMLAPSVGAPYQAKKERAATAPRTEAEVAQARAREDAAPRRDEEKAVRAEQPAPASNAAPGALALDARPPPSPSSSQAPVDDPARERFAYRLSKPESGGVKKKRAAADVPEDARKADALEPKEADEEPLDGLAGSAASAATSGEPTARSRQAPGQPALADRSPSAAPRPASQQEEIDAMARALDERRRAGQLPAVAIAPCPGQGEVERRFYRDHGRIVIYQRREPTSDGSVTVDYYYDRAGHLRLARITRIQAGRRTVERSYLDATGERTLSGDRIPGPGGPDPETVLRSSTPCADGP